ncbi:hypothetical protein [Photobacterium indicum]|uniref:hypothetical protein n=1 Tax=Photobacterium indicum TaxID=81447 RepID=UPI003D09EC37
MEFAKEYTKKEKFIRISLLTSLALVAIFTNNLWLKSLLTDFGERPHCYELLGFNGADYVWHLFLVGFPTLIFILISFFLLPAGIQGLREGRFPPRSCKVYKPTLVRKGGKAYLRAGINLLLPTIVLLSVVWGYQQVDDMPVINKEKFDAHLCSKTNKALQEGLGTRGIFSLH